MIGDLANTRDEIGHPLFPDASTVFAALETVSAPAATVPVVYDSSAVVARDPPGFRRRFLRSGIGGVEPLRDLATGSSDRFALAAPLPGRSVRKLAVTGTAAAEHGARAAARPKG